MVVLVDSCDASLCVVYASVASQVLVIFQGYENLLGRIMLMMMLSVSYERFGENMKGIKE